MATLGDLVKLPHSAHRPPPPDLALRWQLLAGEDRQGCLERLSRLWQDWRAVERDLLVGCVESIAHAERIRRAAAARPTQRQMNLARCVMSAARLADDLHIAVSDGGDTMRTVCDSLDQFALTAFRVLVEPAPADAYIDARVALSMFRSLEVGTRVPQSLLADLVRLALGRKAVFDKRGIRRYEGPIEPDRPQATGIVWRRKGNWALLRRASKRRTGDDDGRLAAELRSYLQPDGNPPARTKRGRRPTAEATSAERLVEARRYRDELKHLFRAARRQSPDALGRLVRSLTVEITANLAPGSLDRLLREIANAKGKPSEAAARLAAAKFGLPFSQVRTEKAPRVAPVRTGRITFGVRDLDAVEHAVERARRGRLR